MITIARLQEEHRGVLVVLREVERNAQNRERMWLCCCLCGVEKVLSRGSIQRVLSCGCQKKARLREANSTHGATDSPTYASWRHMLRRCADKKHETYAHYGGRGIAVCPRWVGACGFENFLADMGPRPSPKHSIERKNNDGNYEPSNCVWATREEQARNKRTNKMLRHNGEMLCVAAWAEKLNLPAHTLYTRLAMGWSVDRALSTSRRKWRSTC